MIRKKKTFSLGKLSKCDIVILDSTNSHYITEYILKGLQYHIFNLNTKKIHFNLNVVYYYFISIKLLDFKNLKKSEKKFREVLKQLRYIYFLSCLKTINPKVVISFIDNSQEIHWLSRKLKSAAFFAIQNGNRPKFQLDNKQKQFHKHFFSFGNNDVDRYKRFGHTIERAYPVGSLKAGIYKMKSKNINIVYDISVISQYEEELFQKTKYEDRVKWNSMAMMHTFLGKYIAEYNLKSAIVLRGFNPDISGEKLYFDKFYKNNVIRIINDDTKMSSYIAMDQSNVIIDFFSTASIEAFGWGKKILLCDFTNSNDYNDYHPLIVFKEANYEVFKERVNNLRFENSEDYKKRTKEYASYLMNNNKECPPHIHVRKKIKKYL